MDDKNIMLLNDIIVQFHNGIKWGEVHGFLFMLRQSHIEKGWHLVTTLWDGNQHILGKGDGNDILPRWKSEARPMEIWTLPMEKS